MSKIISARVSDDTANQIAEANRSPAELLLAGLGMKSDSTEPLRLTLPANNARIHIRIDIESDVSSRAK